MWGGYGHLRIGAVIERVSAPDREHRRDAHHALHYLAREYPLEALSLLVRYLPVDPLDGWKQGDALEEALTKLATEYPDELSRVLRSGIVVQRGEAPLLLQEHDLPLVRLITARACARMGTARPVDALQVLDVLARDSDEQTRRAAEAARSSLLGLHHGWLPDDLSLPTADMPSSSRQAE